MKLIIVVVSRAVKDKFIGEYVCCYFEQGMV